MPNKLTDAEIKKALECCSSGSFGCEKGCPLDKECDSPIKGGEKIMKSALDLINRLETKNSNLTSDLSSLQNDLTSAKAEVEKFNKENENLLIRLCKKVNQESKTIEKLIKAEAYKEFAERLKEEYTNKKLGQWNFEKAFIKQINNLLNELVGDVN